MAGYICRFCSRDSVSESGFVSLEISTINRKIIIYVCRECQPRLASSRIMRCQGCGNIWLKKDTNMSGVAWTMAHCSQCNPARAAHSEG
jgi:hypothetical protein